MKTDHDLLAEFVKYLLEQAGGTHEAIQQKLEEMNRTFALRPPQPLTDQAYEEKLRLMKQEAPAYLRHLGLQ